MSSPAPNEYQQFFDGSGNPLAGGKLYSYAAGTNTPLSTYTDESGGTPNANPTILDSKGRATIWIPQTTGYKFQLQDSLSNVIWTVDNVFLIANGSITSKEIGNQAVGTNQLASNPVTTAKFALQSITAKSGLLASKCVTTVKFTVGAVTITKISPAIDMSSLNNSILCPIQKTNDFSGMESFLTPQYLWSSPSKLSNPGTLPAAAANAVAWSPDGRFLAVGHGTSPFVTIYERSGTTLTKLTNPGTLPASTVNGLAWSPNSDFLCCAHTTTPFMTVYQRRGLNFTKLTDPGTLPAFRGMSAAFSPNGEFLAVQAASIVPVGATINIYQMQGSTINFLTTTGGDNFVAWSPDSQYLTTGTQSTNDAVIYQRAGTNFNLVPNPTASQYPLSAAWSPDGQFLALGLQASPYIAIYQFSAGTFTLLSTPATIPSGAVTGICWSFDGNSLAVAFAGSPFMLIYTRSGTTFTANANPVSLPGTDGSSISFSPSNQFASIGIASSPFINTYQTGSAMPATATLYGRNFANA